MQSGWIQGIHRPFPMRGGQIAAQHIKDAEELSKSFQTTKIGIIRQTIDKLGHGLLEGLGQDIPQHVIAVGNTGCIQQIGNVSAIKRGPGNGPGIVRISPVMMTMAGVEKKHIIFLKKDWFMAVLGQISASGQHKNQLICIENTWTNDMRSVAFPVTGPADVGCA